MTPSSKAKLTARMFPEDQQLIEELLPLLSLVLMCVTSDVWRHHPEMEVG